MAPLFGTELRDIRHKIEGAKDAGEYPPHFQLPGYCFAQHGRVLAQRRKDLYEVVERAYTAAHRVNERIDVRVAKRRSTNRTPLYVEPDDGLDEAHGLAGEALDALGIAHE